MEILKQENDVLLLKGAGYLIVTNSLKHMELQLRVQAGEQLSRVITEMFYIHK